jgi:hypothetical protein
MAPQALGMRNVKMPLAIRYPHSWYTVIGTFGNFKSRSKEKWQLMVFLIVPDVSAKVCPMIALLANS